MELPLKDKIALVTGSSRGIGRATALKLAGLGADVCINHVNPKNSAKAAEVARLIRRKGRRVMVVRADVSIPKDVSRLVRNVNRKLGRIDILVNNAGIFRSLSATSPEKISLSEWHRVLDVNLIGPALVTVQVIKLHDYSKEKLRVINIASVAGVSGATTIGCHYAASKAGVLSLTQSFAKAYKNILINSVSPGLTNTGPELLRLYTAKDIERHTKESQLNRLLKPEEIAQAVAFLATQDAVTANNMIVDGGRLKRQ